MGYTFTGATKRIDLTSGTVAVDVKDLYSRWKDWVAAGAGQWPQAFACVGGEETGPGVYITTYAFLLNGWRVRPQEADHGLTVGGGVLLTTEGDDPIIATLGAYNVLVRYSQPIKTETVATGGVDVNAMAAALWALIGPSGNTTLESLETAAADAAIIRQIERGRWRIDTAAKTLTLYAADGTTPLQVFDLKDAAGNASATDIFERVPV